MSEDTAETDKDIPGKLAWHKPVLTEVNILDVTFAEQAVGIDAQADIASAS